jgi:hypothetical protein
MSLPQNGPITLPDCGSCGAVDERNIDTNIMIEHWFVLEEANTGLSWKKQHVSGGQRLNLYAQLDLPGGGWRAGGRRERLLRGVSAASHATKRAGPGAKQRQAGSHVRMSGHARRRQHDLRPLM